MQTSIADLHVPSFRLSTVSVVVRLTDKNIDICNLSQSQPCSANEPLDRLVSSTFESILLNKSGDICIPVRVQKTMGRLYTAEKDVKAYNF